MVLRVLPPQGSLVVLNNEQELALLSCCRQIHHEAASLFYQLVEFRIAALSDIHTFYDKVNVRYQPLVRSVAMWWPDFNRVALQPASTPPREPEIFHQSFPNLEELVVRGLPKHLQGAAAYWQTLVVPLCSTKGKVELVIRS